MMTKEQVAEIVRYCSEHSVTIRQRLKEIGVSERSFYYAKKVQRERESGVREGDFVRLLPDSPFPGSGPLPGGEDASASGSVGHVTVELRTPGGSLMRISGRLDPSSLASVVNAACRV